MACERLCVLITRPSGMTLRAGIVVLTSLSVLRNVWYDEHTGGVQMLRKRVFLGGFSLRLGNGGPGCVLLKLLVGEVVRDHEPVGEDDPVVEMCGVDTEKGKSQI
jgi:hypothetical protein